MNQDRPFDHEATDSWQLGLFRMNDAEALSKAALNH